MVSDDDIPNILLDNVNADDISINRKCKPHMDDSNKNESCDTLQLCNIHKSYTEIHHTQSTSHEICEKYAEDESSSENDQKLLEDQAALDQRQNMIGDPLPSVVQYDMENCIYNCAPGENNIPKYVLLDDDFTLLVFPDLFPYGCGAYNYTDRSAKLPVRKYFQQHLLNVDGHFTENIEYLCTTYNRFKSYIK